MKTTRSLWVRRVASAKRVKAARPADRRALRKAVVTIAAAAAGLGALVAGLVVARATPGGASSPTLTFAGTLRDANGKPLSGKPALDFVFKKQNVAACTCTTTPVEDVDAQGAFRAVLDLGAAKCPATLFDGSDVSVDVKVGGALVAGNQPIGAVPYAKYADHLGSPDCPVGYDVGAAPGFLPGAVLCVMHNASAETVDEVVKVGSGSSAFWIDRYEASLWTTSDPHAGVQRFAGFDNSDATFPKSAQFLGAAALYARSVASVTVASYVTYFQALEGCQASGKRLATGAEWLRAARGTFDPGGNDGTANTKCNTQSASLRKSGHGLGGKHSESCVSVWGAEDMVGNYLEITDEMYANVGDTTPPVVEPWPDASFNNDGTWNVTSKVYNTTPNPTLGVPAVGRRGGNHAAGVNAGVFALDLYTSPAAAAGSVGFRCVVTR